MDLRDSSGKSNEIYFDYQLWQRIPHYYGDIVRQLFLGLVVLMMVGAPFFADDLAAEFPFIILGSIVIAGLAALTNPVKNWVMYLNVIAAGVGLFMFETTALAAYSAENPISFALRQAIAVIFLFAFYFGAKTARAMLMGKIGEVPSEEDFGKKPAQKKWKDMVQEQGVAPAVEELVDNEEIPLDGLGNPAAPDTDKLD